MFVLPRVRRSSGFTLLEIVVVLVLLGVTAAVVAPAWVVPRDVPTSQLELVLRETRVAAARRAETLYLSIASGGRWRLEGRTPGDVLATGALDAYAGPPGTLVVSPLGTCGFDARSAGAVRHLVIDPLRCEPAVP